MKLTGFQFVQDIQSGRAPMRYGGWIDHMRMADQQVLEIVEPGRVVSIWTPSPECAAMDQFVMGGVIATLGDTGIGMAVLSSLDTDPVPMWTIDLHTRFLRPIDVGARVRIDSKLLSRTKSTAIGEAQFTVEGKLAALVTAGLQFAGDRRSFEPAMAATS